MRDRIVLRTGILLFWALFGWSCQGVFALGWSENIGMLVRIDEQPSGFAHVYDSDDYQRMLLTVDDRSDAAVLDLATASVYAIPRDSVRVEGEDRVTVGDAAEKYVGSFEHETGALAFLWEDSQVVIEPLPPLVGVTDLEQVFSMKPSYAIAAEAYQPDSTLASRLRNLTTPTELRVYFGTWCHLCKMLVPPLIGTIQRIDSPAFSVMYVGVDEELTEPADRIAEDIVSTTPTIIVLQKGEEIGRIEEEVSQSIEADLAKILFGSD